MALEQARSHMHAGRLAEAIPVIEAYLHRQTGDAQAWFLLGACRHTLKNLAGATAAFSRSIELRPDNIEAYLALASVARDAGDLPAALACCDSGIETAPSEPRLFHAKALALQDLGRDHEALTQYEQALKLAPQSEGLLHDFGLLLTRMGRLGEAEVQYRTYIDAYPGSLPARCGLADTLLARGRYDEVIALLDPAPSEALLLVRRGFALAAQRRLEEARHAFAAARAADPESVAQFVQRTAPGEELELMLSPESIFLDRCYAALCQCDWSRWDAMIAESRRTAAMPAVALEPAVGFMVRFLPLSGAERHAVSRQIAARIEASVAVLSQPTIRHRQRIRVGVLSPDFREHINAYLLLPLFELLDRQRFEVHAYSLAPDDGSAARARIRGAADVFCDLHAMSDSEATRLIRRNDVDIIIDAAGHTTGGRFGIVARRPARVHVNYLGFSSSMGSKRVDYAIVDRISAPSTEEWSEALAYVPNSFFLYDYRVLVPEIAVSRHDYGLPESAFVYCAFHRPEKISPDIFGLWMEVLSRVPKSVMWFHPMSGTAVSNLRTQASRHGIDPSRLVFTPFEPRYEPRYLARQRLGDLFLDSLHHNAMTTACDALGVGLPVLTVPGSAIAARAGASLLHAAGLPELVSPNTEEFVKAAVRLGSERALLQEYKQKLLRNRSTAPLFDTAAMVRALAAAFEHMLARAQRGESPASFEL